MALIRCAKCGRDEHAELIDAKPSNGDFECGDYDRFECIECYGPGWAPLSYRSIDKSVRKELQPLYAAWMQNEMRERALIENRLADLAAQREARELTAFAADALLLA